MDLRCRSPGKEKWKQMTSCFVELVEHRLTQAGSNLASLIMAHTESKGLNYRTILIGTTSDLRFEKVLGKGRKSNCLDFVVTFYNSMACLHALK